jgi:hypothetical protein
MLISSYELQELTTFFNTTAMPKQIKLNEATTILDTPRFVWQVLANLAIPDIAEVTLRPRYEDLLCIKKLLETGSTGN